MGDLSALAPNRDAFKAKVERKGLTWIIHKTQ